MKKLIVVADWVDDSLTCQEVRSATEGFLQSPEHAQITFVSSTPHTIHTAFLLNQISETEEHYGRPLDTVIFQNTDPMQEHTEEYGGIGAELFIIRLKSGLHILGPNSGNVFSLIKPKIEEVFCYKGLEMSGQFRSRDVFAKLSAYFMDSLQDDLELDEMHTNLIPELQSYYVGHIDNYGNIKTTIKESELKGKFTPGAELSVTINNVTQKATYLKNLYDGQQESLILYPGSSGNPLDLFMEISICTDLTQENAKTGIHLFNNPKPGMKIMLE